MVKQGSILKLDLNPTKGREQRNYRPVVVVSNTSFYKFTQGLIIVCPITNTFRNFPLRVSLDDRTQTSGYIITEQPRTIDLEARDYRFIEMLPADQLTEIIEHLGGFICPNQNSI